MRSGNELPALGNLLNAAREQRAVEKAVAAAKETFAKEVAAARKAVKDNSYCWTTKDVAQEFGRHPKTIEKWRQRLGLPSKKFGRNVMFRPGDVRRWAVQRKEG